MFTFPSILARPVFAQLQALLGQQQQHSSGTAAAPTGRMRRVQQPLLRVFSNVSCDGVACVSLSDSRHPRDFTLPTFRQWTLYIRVHQYILLHRTCPVAPVVRISKFRYIEIPKFRWMEILNVFCPPSPCMAFRVFMQNTGRTLRFIKTSKSWRQVYRMITTDHEEKLHLVASPLEGSMWLANWSMIW